LSLRVASPVKARLVRARRKSASPVRSRWGRGQAGVNDCGGFIPSSPEVPCLELQVDRSVGVTDRRFHAKLTNPRGRPTGVMKRQSNQERKPLSLLLRPRLAREPFPTPAERDHRGRRVAAAPCRRTSEGKTGPGGRSRQRPWSRPASRIHSSSPVRSGPRRAARCTEDASAAEGPSGGRRRLSTSRRTERDLAVDGDPTRVRVDQRARSVNSRVTLRGRSGRA
jgi:hypothetical protein